MMFKAGVKKVLADGKYMLDIKSLHENMQIYFAAEHRKDKTCPVIRIILDNQPPPSMVDRLQIEPSFKTSRTYCISMVPSKYATYLGTKLRNHLSSSSPDACFSARGCRSAWRSGCMECETRLTNRQQAQPTEVEEP